MSTHDVELIKERLNVAEVVGEYVVLKQAGNHFKGLCPFHQEKTPSFVVSPDRGIWHCFGCQEGGDVVSFVQRLEGLDFPATLKLLAERAGVTLTRNGHTAESRDHRTRVFDLLSLTARFYHELLVRHKGGQPAREYLESRGVLPATQALFQIGYAPPQWQLLQNFLLPRGYTVAELRAAGVIGQSQRGKMYDLFRGRIIFPIHDLQGRVVAFGGRITPWCATGEEGKYINSPETTSYEKRRVVYNLHRARGALRETGVGIVVEGYMDAVMLVQQGIRNVVATSGTALTGEHVTQLKRFVGTLHFAFDADAAGAKAALKATATSLSAGMRVATVVLPPGQDPADVVQQTPASAAAIFNTPHSLISILLNKLKQSVSEADREQVWREVLPFVRQVTNPVQQGEMIKEMAVILHVPESVVMTHLQRLPSPVPSPAEATDSGFIVTSAPQRLLGLLLLDVVVRQALWPDITEEIFVDTKSIALYRSLQQIALRGEEFFAIVSDDLVAQLESALQSFAYAILTLTREQQQLSSLSPLHEGQQLLRRLRTEALGRRLQALQQQVGGAGVPSAPGALQEFHTLTRALAKLQRD